MSVFSQHSAIRNAVKVLLEGASLGVDIHCFKKTTLAGEAAVCVFFDEGEIDQGAQQSLSDAELIIMVMRSDATDVDQALDLLAGPIDDAIAANDTLGGQVALCELAAWNYERDPERSYTSLNLQYHVQYLED